MTIATMGRRMKKSAIRLLLAVLGLAFLGVAGFRLMDSLSGGRFGHLRGGLRLHRHTLAHLLQALGHDALARLQPLHDQHAFPDGFTHLGTPR